MSCDGDDLPPIPPAPFEPGEEVSYTDRKGKRRMDLG